MKITHDNHRTGVHWSIERVDPVVRWKPTTGSGKENWGSYREFLWLGWRFLYQQHDLSVVGKGQ